jgi:hypothetical protein
MRKLEFIGKVQPDATPDLLIPGRDDLFLKPDDWPSHLAPGFMTIKVSTFPEGFAEIGESEGLARLETGKFRPAFVIPQRKLIGSTLTPTQCKNHQGKKLRRTHCDTVATEGTG